MIVCQVMVVHSNFLFWNIQFKKGLDYVVDLKEDWKGYANFF